MNNDYRNIGAALSRSIMKQLIPLLISNRTMSSNSLFEEVEKYHLENGGEKSYTKNPAAEFSKALTELRNSGKMYSPTRGIWRKCIETTSIGSTVETSKNVEEDVLSTNMVGVTEPRADIEVGEGAGMVYLFYAPTYRKNAEDNYESVWHCKIGRTSKDPIRRVLEQAAVALSEYPRIHIICNTNHPAELEKAIHHILTIRGAKLYDSPGTEWFLTNPDEVLKIIEFIHQKRYKILAK